MARGGLTASNAQKLSLWRLFNRAAACAGVFAGHGFLYFCANAPRRPRRAKPRRPRKRRARRVVFTLDRVDDAARRHKFQRACKFKRLGEPRSVR